MQIFSDEYQHLVKLPLRICYDTFSSSFKQMRLIYTSFDRLVAASTDDYNDHQKTEVEEIDRHNGDGAWRERKMS